MSDAPQQPAGNCEADDGGCVQALEDLHRYLDGELPDRDLEDIRSHLERCYPCTDRATFEQQLRAVVRERCAERAPEELKERIRERLKASG